MKVGGIDVNWTEVGGRVALSAKDEMGAICFEPGVVLRGGSPKSGCDGLGGSARHGSFLTPRLPLEGLSTAPSSPSPSGPPSPGARNRTVLSVLGEMGVVPFRTPSFSGEMRTADKGDRDLRCALVELELKYSA